MRGLTHLPTNFVECRTIAHAWDEVAYDGHGLRDFQSAAGVICLQFSCARCNMQRREAWSRVTGDLLRRHYQAPDDYALPKGVANRRTMRREYLERYGESTGQKARGVA